MNRQWNGAAFLEHLFDLPNMPRCTLLASTYQSGSPESLSNAEEVLMLEWMSPFPGRSSDVRFALRAALHDPSVSSRFDYVLIDCPPRMSTACINAIVACDRVLPPVVPDYLSATIPLPDLLRELRQLNRRELFPEFDVLGIVVNRFQGSGAHVIQAQENALAKLDSAAKTAWGHAVHRFSTQIKQSATFTKSTAILGKKEDTAVVVWEDAAVKETFKTLTEEIVQRIHDEAPSLAVVSS